MNRANQMYRRRLLPELATLKHAAVAAAARGDDGGVLPCRHGTPLSGRGDMRIEPGN